MNLTPARSLSPACSCGKDESKPQTCALYGLSLYPKCGCCMKAGVLHEGKDLGHKADWIVCGGCCIPILCNGANYCISPYTCCASEATVCFICANDCSFPCSDDVPCMLTLFLPGLVVYPKCGCCAKVEDIMGPPANAVHPQGAAAAAPQVNQVMQAPMMPVMVPPGAVPGGLVLATTPTGQSVQIPIPPGAVPGTTIMVPVPQPVVMSSAPVMMAVVPGQGAPPAPEVMTGLDHAPAPQEMSRGSAGGDAELILSKATKPMPV